jgi:hypothetical protein
MGQLVPTATLLPQPLSTPKSLELVVTLDIVSGMVAMYPSVTVCGRLEAPTYWGRKPTFAGDKTAMGAG